MKWLALFLLTLVLACTPPQTAPAATPNPVATVAVTVDVTIAADGHLLIVDAEGHILGSFISAHRYLQVEVYEHYVRTRYEHEDGTDGFDTIDISTPSAPFLVHSE